MPTLPLIAALLAVVACSGPDGETTGATDDSGADFEPHPLVPDEFKHLWHTDYCTKRTQQGQEYKADQVYMHLVDARSTPDSFEGTENIYWFWKKTGWEGDCMDVMHVSGEKLTGDFSQYGCSECNEGWKLTRTLETDNCGVQYRYVFDETEALSEEYWGWVMFDTLTPTGPPYEDNLMRVAHSYIGKDGMAWNQNWCLGYCHVYFETDVYGPPATYDWVSEFCQG